MADENTEVQASEAPPKFNNTIKLIIAGIVVIILAAGMSFVVAMYAAKSVSKAEAPKDDGNGKVKSETIGTTYDAGEYISNLNSEGMIKLKIVFAFADPKAQEEIANKLPEIQHTINSILRQQKRETLAEPKAMEKLAETLKKSVNSLLVNGSITNVYFTSFLVQ
jgi:flagellar FliL protein